MLRPADLFGCSTNSTSNVENSSLTLWSQAAPTQGRSERSAAGRGSGHARIHSFCAQLSLVCTLAGLVVRERIGRIDVRERVMVRCDLLPARGADAEALTEDADDRSRLHLAYPGQPQKAPFEFFPVFRIAPHCRRIPAVVAHDRRRELLRTPS